MSIFHIYRESNICADTFANMECDLDSYLMFYEQIPAQISFLLLNDCIKVSTHKMIVM